MDPEHKNQRTKASARATHSLHSAEAPTRAAHSTRSANSVRAKRSGHGESSLPAVLSVGEVAARSGLAVSAIHFYEKQALIRSARTGGNQRRYPREVLRRVAVIKVAQRLGIPLAAIREALGTLPWGRTPTARDWKTLSSVWRVLLDERIDKLTRLRGNLSDCIGCGCLSLNTCPLRNPGDELAADGCGPRLL